MTQEVGANAPQRPPPARGAELVATAVALAAAAASGAELFALSATGRWKFSDLLLYVGAPAAAVLAAVLAVAILMGWQRLSRGILLGFTAGLIASVGLEAVRITGFRAFHSMPGDLPTLIGVQATDRIMLGPTTSSTIIGYLDHFWNGAMFGVIFALIICWFPKPRRVWTAAAIGAAYGLAVGAGFAIGPVPRTLGIGGVFSTVTVAEFQTTIYLAHLAFGVLLGLLVYAQRGWARGHTIMTNDDGAASHTAGRASAAPLTTPPELFLSVGAILATIAILLGIIVDIGAAATIVVLSIWLFGMWRAHDEHNKHLPQDE